MAELPIEEVRARALAMRSLRPGERAAAIDAAGNVIGVERFARHVRQAQLARAYRKPSKPAPEASA